MSQLTKYRVIELEFGALGFQVIAQNEKEMYFQSKTSIAKGVQFRLVFTEKYLNPYSGELFYSFFNYLHFEKENSGLEFSSIEELKNLVKSVYIGFLNFTYSQKTTMETKNNEEIKSNRFLTFTYQDGGIYALLKRPGKDVINYQLPDFLYDNLPSLQVSPRLLKSLSIKFSGDWAEKHGFGGFLSYMGDKSVILSQVVFPFTDSKSKAIQQIQIADSFFESILSHANESMKDPDAITPYFVDILNSGSLDSSVLKTTVLDFNKTHSINESDTII